MKYLGRRAASVDCYQMQAPAMAVWVQLFMLISDVINLSFNS